MDEKKSMQKKLWSLRSVTVGLTLAVIATSANPMMLQKIEQSPFPSLNGDWLYVGGNGPGNYTKIQDAINASSNGDTIFVYDDLSPYSENLLTLTKSITLIGENKNTTIIQSATGTTLINVSHENITIRGFTIRNTTDAYNPHAITIYANHCEISENIFIGNWDGMEIDSDYCTITNNNFINNIVGIRFWRSYYCEIKNNFFINHTLGIVVGGIKPGPYAHHSRITHNTLINNSWDAIRIIGSFNHISSNFISNNNNDAGVDIKGNFNNISDNNITHCAYGIFLKYSDNNTLYNNVIITNCIEGIYIGRSNNNIVRSNLIKQNNIGIFLYESSQNNIQNNNVIHNSISAMFHTSNNYWNGNYWNRLRIMPKPIIGLFLINVMRIPVIEFDLHPAQEPYDIPGLT